MTPELQTIPEDPDGAPLTVRPDEVSRLFEALALASGAVVWWADEKGAVQALNPPARAVGLEAWQGFGWQAAIHPEDDARVRDAWQEALRRRSFAEITFRALKGESYRWFRVRGALVSGIDGEAARWIGLITDVDDDGRAREELARREEAFRSLVRETASVVWRWTPEGAVAEGDGWALPSRYSSDEWLQFVHPDDRARAASDWAEARASGRATSLEFRFLTDRGEHRWCLARSVPLRDRRGKVTEWVGSLTDVHDERLARAALQRKDKLEAIGRLTAGVAHDFNNLLTVITSGAEALTEQLPPGHALRAEAELALHAAERGAELVRRLLTVSRQQPLRPRAIDVGKLLDGLADLVKRTLGENLELTVSHVAAPLACLADPGQLDSALLNVCINARDAMPGGGRLALESGLVSLSDEAAAHLGLKPGPYVMLSVRDSGVGMSAETASRAVDPFFTTKPAGEGSGLGLSTAYGFVRQSGGHFTIASTEGVGTTVRFYLPQAEALPDAPASDGIARAEAGGGAHILLVEDDPLVRDQVARQLQSLGYRVTTAGDGRAALDILAGEDAFALLMTDVMMPGGLNGRELADHARLFRPALPVMFTSGYTDDAIVREGRLGSSVSFLPKPYRRAQLAQAVAEALGRSAA
jgi:signal transduction histidine kinase/ActR/RegA family two-component response regulator